MDTHLTTTAFQVAVESDNGLASASSSPALTTPVSLEEEGDLQSSSRSRRDRAPRPSADLIAPNPKCGHTQLPISSLCELNFMVSVRNLVHNCVCRACGSLAVMPVKRPVGKNDLLGLNTNLL